ncbi:MAG: hypothetical protein Ct9H300mP25_09150 [Acidobacteriota bacterium]|nr:MAG: hypothetical protein Ct9H300mP25_09150 [Acidobacteriota bacterium]
MIFGLGPQAQWILLLFFYAGVASMLPVWLLLQPRDYIKGIQLIIGLGILYGAVLKNSPTIVAPAINSNVPASAPPFFPLLFVTIARGAFLDFTVWSVLEQPQNNSTRKLMPARLATLVPPAKAHSH